MIPNLFSGAEGGQRVTSPLALAVAVFLLGGLYLCSLYNYLLFHLLAEVFSIVIGCGIFMMAWNSRHFLKSGYLMLLGIGWLFISILDLAHALAYKGMRIFATDEANLATQLWVAARLVESVSLVAASWFIHRPLRRDLAFVVYAAGTLLLLLSILVFRVFPDCYVDGAGLTLFKRGSEVAICAILVYAMVLLFKCGHYFDSQIKAWLLCAMALTIASEFVFCLYRNVYDVMNLLGHYFKILAFYFVYKAIIETGLAKPYALLLREVKESEQALLKAKEELDRANAELEQRVRERTASLQEATNDLNSFVYSISHDLRAPLRAQHGFAKILLETHGAVLSPEGIGCLNKVADAATRLDGLVCDLVSYVTVSRDKPALSPLQLRSVVGAVLDGFKDEIQARAARIEADAIDGVVLANDHSVRVAVYHLVSNALKFARPGEPPQVKLWTEHRENMIRLTVQDRGIGIATEHFPKLFGVFQRLQREGTFPGRGIGLALVKKSVERLGGQVGVRSELGVGSSFWLELPKVRQ